LEQSNNQVCIFTSYGSSVGSGHLRRCINLGNFLESKGYSITIVTKITDIDEKNIIPESFISLKTDSFKKNKLIQKIDHIIYNFFLTDLLGRDLIEFLWVREMKIYIVSILSFKTDFSSKVFDLAFFPSVEKHNVIIKNNRNIFTGKNCVLLNPFSEKTEFKINNDVKSVLIFLGGTDPYNITNTVINDLKHNNCNLKFNILMETNLSYPDKFNFKGQVKNFYNELMNNDIAIINGGISRYECMYIGIPTIAISIHKKQFNITKQVSDMGAMINLGIYNELQNNSVSETLTRLVNNKEERISLHTNCKNIFEAPSENYNFILKTILHEKND
jgi:UDP-2,4-diacetamido-2,4,6-trideoxy-beta-L-altropyranose hydrolase